MLIIKKYSDALSWTPGSRAEGVDFSPRVSKCIVIPVHWIYVGNLGNNGNKTELERAFGNDRPRRSVWVARSPPGFAFVEFEDHRNTADAVGELDGRTLCGRRVRAELSDGERRSGNRGRLSDWSRRRSRNDYRRRRPPPRRRSPRRRSFSRSRTRRREGSLSRERNDKPSPSFSRSREPS